MSLRSLLTFLLLAATAWGDTCEVVVYGATPGGVCAALGAAREGAVVILVEPTATIGGMMSSGLSFSDSNQTDRRLLVGAFEEFYQRAELKYIEAKIELPWAYGVKDFRPWTVEPHIAEKVFREMLEESQLQVVTGEQLVSVEKEGTKIKALVTTKRRIEAKVFVDGSYEGDLMAAAKVSWRLGREGRAEFNESLAGKQYPKKPMPISGLGVDGKPLPLITTLDGGPEEEGDKNVMVYSFRLCLTDDVANRIPFPAPAHYDPARFEALRRYFAQDPKAPLPWDLYPLPGGKMDANNGIGKQFSMGIVGASAPWCEADAAGRARLFEDHKQYTLELYRFLTTDESVPAAHRETLAKYGLASDEFLETGHWPPQLYVREGRRLRGLYTLTQADVLTDRLKPDCIGLSSFPIDSHDCQRVARGAGEVVNEGTIFPKHAPDTNHGFVSQIPYRAIVPQRAECENLLVPVALSASHVAYCSIRVEPTWMVVGQSAGVAAALAASKGVAVQDLPYDDLEDRLARQRIVTRRWAVPDLWIPETPFPPLSEIPALQGVTLNVVHAQTPDFQFLHEPRLAWHRGQLWVTFSNAPKEESEPAQVIRFCHSPDGGATWSPPELLAEPLPDGQRYETAPLYSTEEGLYAFVGRYAKGSKTSLGMDIFLKPDDGPFAKATENLALAGFVPFVQPQAFFERQLIMGGHLAEVTHACVAVCRGDILDRHVRRIDTPQPAGYPETALLLREDQVVAIIRPAGKKRPEDPAQHALAAVSPNAGFEFSPADPSNLPMQDSKPFGGTLSTGQRYLIFNAAEGPRRNTLLIAVTAPDQLLPLRRVWKLIEGTPAPIQPELDRLGPAGSTHEWAYPEAVEHDGVLHVVFSQDKRHCWHAAVLVANFAAP